MRRLSYLLIILILATSTTSCTPEKVITLEADDAGSTIEIKPGIKFKVILAGNPTTGYAWETVDLDTAILQQIGEAEFDKDSDLVGSGGILILTFEAVGTGQTDLKLVYHRPWEKDEDPADTYEITIKVL
jgi:inhibitor of cysteine peptidase